MHYSAVAPMWVVTIIDMLAPVLSYMLPQPYGEEIEGICKFLGVTLGEGLLINYAYEALGYVIFDMLTLNKYKRMKCV